MMVKRIKEKGMPQDRLEQIAKHMREFLVLLEHGRDVRIDEAVFRRVSLAALYREEVVGVITALVGKREGPLIIYAPGSPKLSGEELKAIRKCVVTGIRLDPRFRRDVLLNMLIRELKGELEGVVWIHYLSSPAIAAFLKE